MCKIGEGGNADRQTVAIPDSQKELFMKFIIETDKGYICEENAHGHYEKSSNEFYRVETGKWFTSVCSVNNEVDKLGFTREESKATKYSSNIGNRINEIIDRIKFGFENIAEITVKVIKD